MSLLIVNEHRNTIAYPLSNIRSVRLRKKENGEIFSVTVTLQVSGASTPITPYSESGDESVIEPGEELYRTILDGIDNGKTVNLSDFSLEAPAKKSATKKTSTKKTEPEPETAEETPAESETPPEAPAE